MIVMKINNWTETTIEGAAIFWWALQDNLQESRGCRGSSANPSTVSMVIRTHTWHKTGLWWPSSSAGQSVNDITRLQTNKSIIHELNIHIPSANNECLFLVDFLMNFGNDGDFLRLGKFTENMGSIQSPMFSVNIPNLRKSSSQISHKSGSADFESRGVGRWVPQLRAS